MLCFCLSLLVLYLAACRPGYIDEVNKIKPMAEKKFAALNALCDSLRSETFISQTGDTDISVNFVVNNLNEQEGILLNKSQIFKFCEKKLIDSFSKGFYDYSNFEDMRNLIHDPENYTNPFSPADWLIPRIKSLKYLMVFEPTKKSSINIQNGVYHRGVYHAKVHFIQLDPLKRIGGFSLESMSSIEDSLKYMEMVKVNTDLFGPGSKLVKVVEKDAKQNLDKVATKEIFDQREDAVFKPLDEALKKAVKKNFPNVNWH